MVLRACGSGVATEGGACLQRWSGYRGRAGAEAGRAAARASARFRTLAAGSLPVHCYRAVTRAPEAVNQIRGAALRCLVAQ